MKTLAISSKRQISIPKEIYAALHLKEGDKLTLELKEGKLILEPAISIPRSQAWFWSEEVQVKIKKADSNFKAGKSKTYEPDELLKELKD